MKKNIYVICVVTLVLILQQSINVFAKVYGSSSSKRQTYQTTRKSDRQSSNGLKTIRVTDGTDGETLVSNSNNSSFNLDSTRFFITIDGVPTLYSLDPDRLTARREGALFNSAGARFDSIAWSSEDPDTILCLSDGSGSQSSAQLYSYNVATKELRLTKDFSGALSPGETRILNKSFSDDDNIILAWRETSSLPWQYVAVWDRLSGSTFLFDLADPISGVTGFTGAHFDKTGQKLVVNGESTRVWDYKNQPQNYSERIGNDFSNLYTTAVPTDLQVQDPSALLATGSHIYIGVEPLSLSKSGWASHSGSFVYRRSLAAGSSSSREVITINWNGQELSRGESSELSPGSWFFDRTSGELYLRLPNDSLPGTESEIVAGIRKSTESDVIRIARSGGESAQILSENVWRSAPHLRGSVSPDGRFFIFNSKAEKKRSDVFIAAITSQSATAEPIEWTNAVNCTVEENSLTKSSVSTEEDAGALSLQTIESGDGYVQVEASERNSSRYFGLTSKFVAPPKSPDMDFGIQLGSDKKLSITELGVVKKSGIKYGVGDTLKIALQGGVVRYYKNQKLIYTSREALQYPLVTAASLASSSAKIDSALISGAAVRPRVTVNPSKVTLDVNQSKQFTALVSGSKDNRVNWSATGGTVSGNGLYVAPSNSGVYHVVATLVSDSSVSSSAMVNVTSSTADTTPPVIGQVSATGITASSATVVWTTNEPSDSQADYGLTSAYGSSSGLDSRMLTSHSISLAGLLSNRTYNFRVKSRDEAGNLSVSSNFTFTTSGVADTTPPAISSITVINVTDSSATVTWVSNESSDSQVEYGTTSSYGSSTPMPTPMVTNHSVTLNNLSPGTTYNYRAKSRDAAGNLGSSVNLTFSTPATQSASSQIVAYAFNEGSGTTAVDASGNGLNGTISGASWTTQGRYSRALSFDGVNDKVAASNTTIGNRFTIMAWVRNPSHSSFEAIVSIGNARELHLKSGIISFYTGSTRRSFGSAIPINSWQHVALTYDGSKMRAYLNGAQRGSASSVSLSSLTGVLQVGARPTGTTDTDMFSGLIDEVQVLGTNLSATEIQTAMNTPISGGAPADTTPPVISGVSSSSVTDSAATIGWATDEASDTQVEYGTTTSYGSSSTLNPSMVTGHSVSLSSLASNTTYNYRVRSRDAAGNLAVSPNLTFRTAAPPDATPPAISAVSTSSLTHSSVTVNWTTNEASDTQVEYGTTTSYGSSSTLNPSMVTGHSVSLSSLTSNTTYNYRVRSRDAAGNLALSANFTFRTNTAPDTTPPAISGVSASSVTSSGATVNWTTNEASDTQVEYGTTTSYGSSSPLNTSLVTTHSMALSGLAASTTYNYRVKSRDAAGNLATSANFTFTTAAPADTTPPAISQVAASSVTSSAATITWTTNEASNTQVEYGTTTSYGNLSPLNTSLVTNHSIVVAGLAPSTTYNYRVRSRDAAGNLGLSGNFTFITTAAADTTPPAISSVSVTNITVNSATITWITNEASDTQVDYGTTTSYGSSTPLPTPLVINHSATLSGLAGATTFNFRVKSRDAAGNLAASTNFTFTTLTPVDATPPTISSVTASSITTSGATITWTTNEASDTQVEYGTTTSYGSSSPLNTSMVTSHSTTLSSLTANTTYNYRVRSRDAAGNLGISGNFTFTTANVAPPPSGPSFYVAPNGSTSGNGSLSNPWNLQTALNHPSAVLPGATIYLRGGTYTGKFTSKLRGTQSNPITVRSYPGEWAKIDGYARTTLSASINSSTRTMTVANSSGFAEGMFFTFHDGVEGLEEVCQVDSVSGNTVTINRGWSGTAAVSHASGVTVVLGGHNLQIDGADTIYRNLEITNSDPVRVQAQPNTQSAPHMRGSCDLRGARVKLINCVLHDMQEGIGGVSSSFGAEIYGCIIYNNGYVQNNVYSGHGMYLQNSDASNPKVIKDSIVFNNFAIGIQGLSQTGNTVGMHVIGSVVFGNGAQGGTPLWGVLLGANDGTADDLKVDSSFFYKSPNVSSNALTLDFVSQTGRGEVTNTVIGGGRDGIEIKGGSSIKLTGNTVFLNHVGGQEFMMNLKNISSSAAMTVSANRYFNSSGNTIVFGKNEDFRTFSGWQSAFGVDLSGSTNSNAAPPANWVFVRPNQYEPGRAHIIIYNWSQTGTVSVDVSGILNAGDQFEVRNVQNYFASPVIEGTYTGQSLQLPMTGLTVAAPVGMSSGPAHTGVRFNTFVLIKK